MLMRTSNARVLRRAALAAGLIVAQALAGAALAQTAAPAGQEAGRPRAGLMETILQGPKLRTTVPEPQGWVKASRPAEAREPRRVQPDAEPRRPVLTPDQIRAREAELDNVRRRHDRLAQRKPAAGPFASAAPAPAAGPAGQPVGCALACQPAPAKKGARR
jgi:hypothetical protein